MKSISIKLLLVTFMASLIACSGGGGIGGIAGIGGSGYIATGTVTGFGSVFVNGIRFDTGSAVFDIENMTSSEDALSIGMIVQIEGSIDADGLNGTATRVRYGAQLEGPINGVIISNADATEKTFSVLGTMVIVDSVETVFSGLNFSFDTIALNNLVEISGYYDQDNTLRATYIELESASFTENTDKVEIEGMITNLSGNQFDIKGVEINADSASLSGFDSGLQEGLYVEVEGFFDSVNVRINATEIEFETLEFEDNVDVSLEGYITRYENDSDFDINGIPVNASDATKEPATLMLALGTRIEVEGQYINNVFVADEIEGHTGEAKVHAIVTSVDINASSFNVSVVSSENDITVMVNTSTTMEDGGPLEIENFSLSQLDSGDFVEVIGFENIEPGITANKVKRSEESKILLQGIATAATGSSIVDGSITILGVEFAFSATTTGFEGDDDLPLSPVEIDQLLSGIAVNTPLIKIVDEDANGIADEIDQE